MKHLCDPSQNTLAFGHTHTRLTALCPGLSGWASTRKVKTNLDFTEARDSEWQWHQLGHMHGCTSLQADNHASTPPISFLHARCPSCHATNSVKAFGHYLKTFLSSEYLCILCIGFGDDVLYICSTFYLALRYNKFF